jgi:CheY-like chemotaxis protein
MPKLLRVLIIDDSDDDAELILRALRRAGYRPSFLRVATAGTLTTALGEKEWEWDLITCDYAMPGFSGLAAVPIVRALAPRTPIIAVSGHLEEARAIEVLRAGVEAFVSKDQLDDFGRVVAEVLAAERRGPSSTDR